MPVWTSSRQLIAVIVASSLIGGCGLSHEHVEEGCNWHLCQVLGAEYQGKWSFCFCLQRLKVTYREKCYGLGLTTLWYRYQSQI